MMTASKWSSFDLAWWPSFWPQVNQFWTRLRNHQDKHFEQDSWWLLQKCDCWSVNKVFLPLIWPSDLVFYPKWPSFELDLEIIKTNILSNIHDNYFKNVTSRVLTSLSFDLACWSSFWPQVTQVWTWPKFHKGKHSEQVSLRLDQNCDL